ncbi:coiled-coil and C2 domain-containing protein 1B-like [Electrophorus electricus]|uniref:coiled-coil and C2 domain-containing protein 1B-like n=1 Tax=Electrophorus electricus TaxID=8005 RepID=UPI0015D0A428|nr:coiled-coil and C2 domain-containing protein 1B-like [Electrophorus electricus]
MVLSRQKEYKLADVQAKQTGDIEQVKHYCMMAKHSQKLESTVEASKHSEFEDVRSFLPPPEGVLDEEQNDSLQSTDELRAVTKNSDSFGDELQVNHTTVSDQEAIHADPIMF